MRLLVQTSIEAGSLRAKEAIKDSPDQRLVALNTRADFVPLTNTTLVSCCLLIPWAEVYTRIPPLLSENKGVKPIPLLISRDKSVRV